MGIGSDGQEQPRILVKSSLGPVEWSDKSFKSELVHPEMVFLRRSDYLVQLINLSFGSSRITSDIEERKSYFRKQYLEVGGDEKLLEAIETSVNEDRFGLNEEWSEGYRQYWFDLADLYSHKSLIDQGNNEELLRLKEGVGGSKKTEWIFDSLDKISTKEGSIIVAGSLHNIAYETARVFGVDEDVDSWRDGVRQAYEDFVAWIPN